MANTKHDTHYYDSIGYSNERGYKRDILFNANNLYEAFLKAKKPSFWKEKTQRYEMNLLPNLARLQEELMTQSYELKGATYFILNERGKTRLIQNENIENRIVKHCLCDDIINPTLQRYLIYDNGASIKGRGISFTRQRLLTHLRRYYATNKTNEGYILLIDFSKYYDNIRHDILKLEMEQRFKDDKVILNLINEIIDSSKVDVSYMNEEEYKTCIDDVFNYLEYMKLDKSKLNGTKYMAKHLNIGDQFSQSAGIYYSYLIDNYIKIVKSVKFYGRYMDDSYIIHKDKQYLIDLLNDLVEYTSKLGIHINLKKTRIVKLSDYFKFLQFTYALTDTGRVIVKINKKTIIRNRRKAKKLINIVSKQEFIDWVKSWYNAYSRYMSRQQKRNIKLFYINLMKGNKEKWNKK